MSRLPAPLAGLPLAGLLLAALLLAAAGLAHAQPREYALDPVHTRIVFDVGHADFSRSLATLSGIQGRLMLDEADLAASSVEVRIPLDRLDFGDADWNRQMASSRWFDVRRHPMARFSSTRVEDLGEGRLRVHGLLELRGMRADTVLEVRFNGVRRNPLTHRQTAGFSATATLDRRAFGMLAYPSLVGNDVAVRIEAEARRGRATLPEQAPVAAEDDEEEI